MYAHFTTDPELGPTVHFDAFTEEAIPYLVDTIRQHYLTFGLNQLNVLGWNDSIQKVLDGLANYNFLLIVLYDGQGLVVQRSLIYRKLVKTEVDRWSTLVERLRIEDEE